MGRIKDETIADLETGQFDSYKGINIGSGQHYADGWWNTDAIATDIGRQPDQLIDIFKMPMHFGEAAFKKAYVGHVLEHIPLKDVFTALRCVAHIAETVMVVGPCLQKAIETDQPQSLLDAIMAPEILDAHPWSHKWTPTESLTFEIIEQAGFEPHIVDIKTVCPPEWPNPSTAEWQTAMWFTSGERP